MYRQAKKPIQRWKWKHLWSFRYSDIHKWILFFVECEHLDMVQQDTGGFKVKDKMSFTMVVELENTPLFKWKTWKTCNVISEDIVVSSCILNKLTLQMLPKKLNNICNEWKMWHTLQCIVKLRLNNLCCNWKLIKINNACLQLSHNSTK